MEAEKAKAKMTEEITAAKMVFSEEMTLGDRNVKLEIANHHLSKGLMVSNEFLVCVFSYLIA